MTTQELKAFIQKIEHIDFSSNIDENTVLVIQIIDGYYRLWEHIYHPYGKYWVKELKRSVKRFNEVMDIRVYLAYSSISDSRPYGYWDCLNQYYQYT